MSELQELLAQHDEGTEPPLRADLVASSLAAGRRRARRRAALRAVGTSGVAAVAAVAVIGTFSATGTGEAPPPRGNGGQTAPARPVPAAASTVLERASLAAASKDPGSVRDDQFIYTRTQMEFNPPGGSQAKKVGGTGKSWVSVDGSREGWHVGPDKLGRTSSGPSAVIREPGFDTPTYEFLASLPTDPNALMALVREHVKSKADIKPNAVPDPDQEVFETISRLNQSLLPPKLGAALYEAAAKIPGVTVVPDVVDAAGRHGIGVTRRSSSDGRLDGPTDNASGPSVELPSDSQMTWIFDKETYEYLGSIRKDAETGELRMSIALLDTGVVDRIRQTP